MRTMNRHSTSLLFAALLILGACKATPAPDAAAGSTADSATGAAAESTSGSAAQAGWGINYVVTAAAQPAVESAGRLLVELTLSPKPYGPVTIDYLSVDGTATAGADFQHSKGRVLFNPGDTRKTLDIALIDDDVSEPDETFTLLLSVTGRATLATPELALTILDDD
jgi:uncharacterized protein